MSDLRAHPNSNDEVDGLDESAEGVPAPNTASEFAAEFALPAVVPRRVHGGAVLALVLAFVLPVVAIPIAYRVIRKLQHDGGRGRAVAQVAIVLSYLNILLIALVVLNIVVATLLHRGI